MSTHNTARGFEYPDAAGYPDGAGFLDEGTANLVDGVLANAVRGSVDQPSADAESDVTVHHDDHERVYTAMVGGVDLANIRYEEVDGRTIVLTTTVVPEFRERGIAGELIAYTLNDFRERGQRITVYCRVVAAFIASNKQYADLIDPEHPGL
jgi:uncharacterized protein